MKPYTLIAIAIVTLALVCYTVGTLASQRSRRVTATALGFLALGLIFDIVATIFMILGSGTLISLHGVLGYSALAGMLIEVAIAWRWRSRHGERTVTEGMRRYARLAYGYWLLAFISGGCSSACRGAPPWTPRGSIQHSSADAARRWSSAAAPGPAPRPESARAADGEVEGGRPRAAGRVPGGHAERLRRRPFSPRRVPYPAESRDPRAGAVCRFWYHLCFCPNPLRRRTSSCVLGPRRHSPPPARAPERGLRGGRGAAPVWLGCRRILVAPRLPVRWDVNSEKIRDWPFCSPCAWASC